MVLQQNTGGAAERLIQPRRQFLMSAAALIAASAIVRADSLMPVRVWTPPEKDVVYVSRLRMRYMDILMAEISFGEGPCQLTNMVQGDTRAWFSTSCGSAALAAARFDTIHSRPSSHDLAMTAHDLSAKVHQTLAEITARVAVSRAIGPAAISIARPSP
jgi:hypothetical protein